MINFEFIFLILFFTIKNNILDIKLTKKIIFKKIIIIFILIILAEIKMTILFIQTPEG